MTNETHKRGMRLLTPSQHNRQLHGWWRRRDGIQIGKSIIPERLETEHFLITGSTGAGKSVLLRGLLRQIRERGQIAILLDPESEYIQEFLDEGRGDVVLNPLDARCPFWSPWLEFTESTIDSDVESLSESLVRGTPGSSKDDYFLQGAREVLEVMLKRTKTMDELMRMVGMEPGHIHRALKGTGAYHHISTGGPAQSQGVLGTIQKALKPFQHLREDAERRWSARTWVHEPKGWIFLSSVEGSRAAIRNMQGVWLDFLTRWLLDPSVHLEQQQLWIIADELPVLGRQPMIQALATRGRKRGLALVMGFQNVSQVREIYGRDAAITLTSAPTTKIIMRCDEPETAKYGSDLLGGAEVIRTLETKSSNHSGSGTSRAEHHISSHIVTPAEIQKLPRFSGYLAVAGHDRTTINVPLCFLEKREPAFMARAGKSQGIAAEPPKPEIPDHLMKLTKSSYKSALLRCTEPTNISWKYYGGADPPVELRISLEEIIEEIGPRPCKEKTLDRKDPWGHYERGNIRWATEDEQRKNRRKPQKGEPQLDILFDEEKV